MLLCVYEYICVVPKDARRHWILRLNYRQCYELPNVAVNQSWHLSTSNTPPTHAIGEACGTMSGLDLYVMRLMCMHRNDADFSILEGKAICTGDR